MADCNCEFCEKCPNCGHKADEHMAGDFNAGICFICQKLGAEHCSDMHRPEEYKEKEITQ